ncbi:MAG: DUF2062 domain-containing protein [Candidatus Omnitrophota bacterium]
MLQKLWLERIQRLIKLTYLKLFRINDTPLKIALGFGLGAFLGIMPGVGPVTALVLAFLLKVNRASAVFASIIFNTWVSLIALLSAVRVGAIVMGLNYQDVYAGWKLLIRDFNWQKLFAASVHDILIPVIVGYFIISFLLAIAATIIVYLILVMIRNKRKKGSSNKMA